jgi:hypothetical protein
MYAHTDSPTTNRSRYTSYPKAWNHTVETSMFGPQTIVSDYVHPGPDRQLGMNPPLISLYTSQRPDNEGQYVYHNAQESLIAQLTHPVYSSSSNIFQGSLSDETRDTGPRNVHGIRLRPTSDLRKCIDPVELAEKRIYARF